MLALFLIGLLASGLHCSLAQAVSRPTSEDRLANLEELVKALGNGLDKVADKVDKLLEEAQGNAPKMNEIWLPLAFIEARRQYEEEKNTFSFKFKSAMPVTEVEMLWRLQPVGQKVTDLKPDNNMEVTGDSSYNFGVTTAVEVEERGELTLTLRVKGFEVILLFDNSALTAKQSRRQRDIPFNNFAVDVPDLIDYQKGEQVILPVMAKNAGEDKYKLNVELDLTYISPSKRIAVHQCLVKGQDDLVCESDIKKKYFSSMDAELLINTGIVNPTGYSKVHSTYEDFSALVSGVRLIRILKIVPSGQKDAYPEDFFDVVASDADCPLTEKECEVSCLIYGQMPKGEPKGVGVEFSKMNEDDKPEKISGQISYLDNIGEKTASTSYKVPEGEDDMLKQKFVCSVKPDKGEEIKATGTVTYTYKTHVLKDKSYLEINDREAKVRCAAAGLESPETAATLSIKPPGRDDFVDVPYSSYENMKVGKRELISVFTFRLYYGRVGMDQIKVKCFARDPNAASGDFDSFEVTKIKFLPNDGN